MGVTPRLILALNRLWIVQERESGRHCVGPGARRRLRSLGYLNRRSRVSRRGLDLLGAL